MAILLNLVKRHAFNRCCSISPTAVSDASVLINVSGVAEGRARYVGVASATLLRWKCSSCRVVHAASN